MEAILAATTTVTTLVGDVFTLATSNAYIAVFFAVSLLGVDIGVFKMLKDSARG